MAKPVIGITANLLVTEGPGFPGLRRVYINEDYVVSLRRAGALPVLLPPVADASDAQALIEGLDGLLVAGGADLHPQTYGEEPHPLLEQTFPDRDASDALLLGAGLAGGLPVLGICRGLQALNVFRGGALYQDLSLSGAQPPVQHRQPATDRRAPGHSVTLKPGSRLHGLWGGTLPVNTFHHQGIRVLGEGLEAVGWSVDGLIEAVEGPGPAYLVAVQWHPEMLAADGDERARQLFADFVRETRGRTQTGRS
jgi:putative glutamine amidotransferase